jgi:hypothetical protein
MALVIADKILKFMLCTKTHICSLTQDEFFGQISIFDKNTRTKINKITYSNLSNAPVFVCARIYI